ncbi:RBP11-like subunits of RNA polymerase [Setomelanomma holmii]|uniref:RBP11-like subunits of RNA polymerase n=1 Tax=Setomelanomma holmii TaxID=210430 RepID=A0A9P4LQX1_9PLEO|nr:RBP11-like subunits of RNA polymerase [Setomelanomma holmii]
MTDQLPDAVNAPCWSPRIGTLVAHEPNCGLRDNQKDNRHVSHKADYDAENRFELFLLDDGQSKVEWKEETRKSSLYEHLPKPPLTNPTPSGVPNTAVFTFNKEDHTLGNLLSQRLLKYDYIVFSAYKVPHPLFATFDLRVSTDGSITPKDAIIKCCRDIVGDLEMLKSSFQTEWLGKKIVSEGEAERMAREQNNF